jgi:hypothetical protein
MRFFYEKQKSDEFLLGNDPLIFSQMGGSENNLCCQIKIINNNNNKFTWKMQTYTKCIYII